MKDQFKTKQAMIQELSLLRQKIAELEQSESDRKNVMGALRENEEKYRVIFNNEIYAILIFDLDTLKLLDVNAAFTQMYGYTREELLSGMTIHNITAEHEASDSATETARNEGTIFIPLRYHKKKDGTIFPVEIVGGPYEWKGKQVMFALFRGITERKRAEEALRESEERYRTIARLSSEFAYSCIHAGHDGYEVDWITDAFFTLTGYSEAELHEQRCWLFVSHPDDREMATEPLRELKAGESDTREFHIVTKGGRVLCIISLMECQADPKAPGGLRLFGAVQDITERKQVEVILRRTEENFRRSLEDSPLGVRIVTIKGETIYANRAILDIYGYDTFEELKTTPTEKRYTPESYAEHRIRRGKRIRGDDVPSEYGISITKKDGEVHHLQVFRKEILWNGERQYQVLYNDITESKRMEKLLQETEKHFRRLAEDMPALICTFLPDSTLTYVNATYCELFQKHFDELIGQKFLYFIKDEAARETVRRQYMSLTPENSVKTYEHDVIIADGTNQNHWHRWTDRAFFKDNGEIDHFQSIGQDITNRKQAEEELRTSRMQLRALATRLQQIREEERVIIAREIHDELGGGLTGLKMDLSWLLHRMCDADPGEERVALMDKIQTANALIDEMIQVVRRISTDLRPSILDDLGLTAALEWQLSEFTKRTEIPHEFATTLEFVDMEDDTAVSVFRIFQEALTNVVRHARATKVVIVLREGERIRFGDETLILEIRDNGRGITEEEILNSESLGLLGMKERVLAFGGNLSIIGEPGGGTTLVLKIPRKQGEPS